MRSGTSFFNWTVFRKNVQRFWPIWALCLVVWLIALPLNGLLELTQSARGEGALLRFAAHTVRGLGGGNPLSLIVAVCGGLAAAMALCSYLYNGRPANFLGALPIRREGLFFSLWLAGLAMLILPNVVVFLLTLLVEAAGGAVVLTPLAFWLLSLSLLEFFFFSFAMFLGMLVGHILMLPVLYGVFNALAVVGFWIMVWVMEAFYYGFGGFSDGVLNVVRWLTPVWKLSQVELQGRADLSIGYEVANGHVLAVYAVAALLLSVCALLLFRRRQLERAGDPVAVGALRPVFRYGVAICSGLTLGFLTGSVLETGELGYMIAIILWGAAGAFVAQMILDKSFRVLRRWKGAAATALVFVVLFAVVLLDLTGYERRVPAADQVESVYLEGLTSYPKDGGWNLDLSSRDPQVIADTVALHQALTEERDLDEDNSYRYNWFKVTYTLKDGSTLCRHYYAVPTLSGQTPRLAQKLLDNRELLWDSYGFDVLEDPAARLVEVTVSGGEEYGYGPSYVSGQDARALLNAVTADFEAGRIGARSLYTGDSWEEEAGKEPTTLGFRFEIQQNGVGREREIWITVADTAEETLTVLAGLELTQAEPEIIETEMVC